jgi:small subunit ribosomal protein S1
MQDTSQAPLMLADLKPNMELQGTVSKIELFGAFVDVGADKTGLVHISKLKRGHINRVEDEVKEGDQVTVWVDKVDPATGRLELTMIRPVTVAWKDIQSGARLTGTVVRIETFGAFIDVGAERPGLLHVSEMRDEYVSDPTEILKSGDEVEVTVLDVDRKKKQFRLSMKVAVYVEEFDEVEEQIPTAMEVALRQAMEEPKADQPAGQKPEAASKGRGELDDILLRTLQQKVKTSAVAPKEGEQQGQ